MIGAFIILFSFLFTIGRLLGYKRIVGLGKLFYVLFTIGVCYAFICWLMLLF